MVVIPEGGVVEVKGGKTSGVVEGNRVDWVEGTKIGQLRLDPVR